MGREKVVDKEYAEKYLTGMGIGDRVNFILSLRQGDLVCVGPESAQKQWPVHRVVSGPHAEDSMIYYNTMFGAVHKVDPSVMFSYRGPKRTDGFLAIPKQYLE